MFSFAVLWQIPVILGLLGLFGYGCFLYGQSRAVEQIEKEEEENAKHKETARRDGGFRH